MLVGLLLLRRKLSSFSPVYGHGGDAVKEGPCEPFRAKELGPLVEGQVGGANTPGLSSHIPRDFDTHTAAFSDTVSLQPVGTISLRQAGA